MLNEIYRENETYWIIESSGDTRTVWGSYPSREPPNEHPPGGCGR